MASTDEGVGDLGISSARMEEYEQEIAALVKFFNEEERLHAVTRYRKDRETTENIQRKKIATLLEGSRLPFSALAKDIFDKLSGENDQDQTKSGALTMVSVKSSVMSLGERISFGITNPDADILEDDSPGSLWCWHARDMKLLPVAFREEISNRRLWRRKIGERISAVSATVDAARFANEVLKRGEIEPLEKASLDLKSRREALEKVDNESVIRDAKASLQQKKEFGIPAQTHSTAVLGEQLNNLIQEDHPASKRRRSDPEERERIRQEKQLKRQQIENEKEQKRKEKEEADRKKQQQKHLDEAERERRRKEKEEADRKKQQQKHLDEAEKERRRKEKEEAERKKQEKKQHDEAEKQQKLEAERKKQLALKKQASIMDRFLLKKNQAKGQKPSCGQAQQAQAQAEVASSPPVAELEKRESVSSSVQTVGTTPRVVARMDVELKDCRDVDTKELLRSHINNWLSIRTQSVSKKPKRWGVRRKPKVTVYRELRLNGTVGDMRGNRQREDQTKKGAETSSPSNLKRAREEFDTPEDVDWKENVIECSSPSSIHEEGKKSSSSSRYHQLRKKKRKLLQFDKSHRPPYYGTFSKRSDFIKPCHPLTRDPTLDYEVDSDAEWEEEDPGESLSDIEKDEEDEKVEIEEIEDDEDGADEFVVPDGYLSEDEGVAMEDSERGVIAVAGGSSENQSPVTPVRQGVMSRERLRKALDDATANAIRTNHPFVISNLGQLPGHEDGTQPAEFPFNRVETMCLEALKMRLLIPNLLIGAC